MARTGHKTRTKLEAAICAEMDRQELRHEHRTLHYRVRMKSGKIAKYEPAVVAHRGPILFLVEPFASATAGAIERSRQFLDQHSPEIVYTIVAPRAVAAKLPPESYDELYDVAAIRECVLRIKTQDPLGAVRPFLKRPVTGSS